MQSLDGGQTFARTFMGACCGSSPQQVFGFPADEVFIASGALLRSTDHGATWTNILWDMPRPVYSFSAFSVWETGPNDIVTGGTHNGYFSVHRTTDGGVTWPFGVGGGAAGEADSVWGSGSDVWAVGPVLQIIHSSDGLATPTYVSLPITSYYPKAVWGSGPDDVYIALHGNYTGVHWLAHTRDGGATWEMIQLSFEGRAGFSAGPRDVYVVGDGGNILHGH